MFKIAKITILSFVLCSSLIILKSSHAEVFGFEAPIAITPADSLPKCSSSYPVPAPSGLTFDQDYYSGLVTYAWAKPSPNSTDPVIEMYDIAVKTVDNYITTHGNVYTDFYTRYKLTPGVTYRWYVRARGECYDTATKEVKMKLSSWTEGPLLDYRGILIQLPVPTNLRLVQSFPTDAVIAWNGVVVPVQHANQVSLVDYELMVEFDPQPWGTTNYRNFFTTETSLALEQYMFDWTSMTEPYYFHYLVDQGETVTWKVRARYLNKGSNYVFEGDWSTPRQDILFTAN